MLLTLWSSLPGLTPTARLALLSAEFVRAQSTSQGPITARAVLTRKVVVFDRHISLRLLGHDHNFSVKFSGFHHLNRTRILLHNSIYCSGIPTFHSVMLCFDSAMEMSSVG